MKKILLLVCLFTSFQLTAQDEEIGKRTKIVFVSSEILGNDNFERTQLLNWAKDVQEMAGGYMKTEKTNSIVKIIASWTIRSRCSYEISICPENKPLADKMLASLKTLESPEAKIAAFQLLFSFQFGDGCKESQSFSPAIFTTPEKMQQQLLSQPLGRGKEMIRQWALDEVIPVLSYYTISVDPKYEGVRKTGESLDKKTFLNKQTTTVTDRNPLYWRAVMEMNKGNLIIPLSKVFMHIANDEFDLARRYLSMLYRFADKQSLAAHYMADVDNLFETFYHHHDSLVRIGIALHDAGKYEQAIQKYNTLISDYPHSAWSQYELYFSTKAKDLGSNADKINELWNQHRDKVYAADPLYPIGGGANNAADGYKLFLRMESKELFRDSKKLKEDMIRYADIALDLEQYAFAAHLYWNLLTVFPEEKYKGHDFFAYYLYSLQKLGVEEVQSFFKTSYKDELNAMDKERSDAIKNNPTYQSFKQ